MSYLINEKPPILVTATAHSDQLTQITLSMNPKGFACNFIGTPSKKLIDALFEFLKGYVNGTYLPLTLSLDLLPPFTREVLGYLQTIPFGHMMTYGEAAMHIGHPKAARAFGSACGRNPYPLLIPCHRIIASKGIGGFSLGLNIKNKLLEFEKSIIILTQNKC